MKVFIEQSGGSTNRNIFNSTGKIVDTAEIKLPYPFPYGYILDTKASDGDCLDCYIITSEELVAGSIIDVEAVGMVEWFEDGVEDHKILASQTGDYQISEVEVKSRITYFAQHYFDHIPEKNYQLGAFGDKIKAERLIQKCSI